MGQALKSLDAGLKAPPGVAGESAPAGTGEGASAAQPAAPVAVAESSPVSGSEPAPAAELDEPVVRPPAAIPLEEDSGQYLLTENRPVLPSGPVDSGNLIDGGGLLNDQLNSTVTYSGSLSGMGQIGSTTPFNMEGSFAYAISGVGSDPWVTSVNFSATESGGGGAPSISAQGSGKLAQVTNGTDFLLHSLPGTANGLTTSVTYGGYTDTDYQSSIKRDGSGLNWKVEANTVTPGTGFNSDLQGTYD